MGHTVYSKTLLFTDIHPFYNLKNTNIGLGLVFNMQKSNKKYSRVGLAHYLKLQSYQIIHNYN